MEAARFCDECWNAAFDVARRYRDFDSYGSEAKAARARERRCPELSGEEAGELLEKALDRWQAAVDLTAASSSRLWQQADAVPDVDMGQFDRERARRCPEAPLEVWQGALGWVWYWHHLR